MRRGRPVKLMSKKEIQLIVKSEISKALAQLDIKVTLTGTKRKGRPIGLKKKKRRRR